MKEGIRVLLEIKGGNLQSIMCNTDNIFFHIIDYDNIAAGDGLDLDGIEPDVIEKETFRNQFTDLSDPLTQEIYHELQNQHL